MSRRAGVPWSVLVKRLDGDLLQVGVEHVDRRAIGHDDLAVRLYHLPAETSRPLQPHRPGRRLQRPSKTIDHHLLELRRIFAHGREQLAQRGGIRGGRG